MSVGTSDGQHYEEEIDHILDRPLQFDEPTLKEPGGEEDMVSPRALTSTPKPSMPAVKRGIEMKQMDLQDTQQTGPVDHQVIPGEGVPNTQGRDIRRSDLDRRTPPPLPVVPSHSIAPHNPNPPGGGPYNIKPGEKLSMDVREGGQQGQYEKDWLPDYEYPVDPHGLITPNSPQGIPTWDLPPEGSEEHKAIQEWQEIRQSKDGKFIGFKVPSRAPLTS